MKRITPNFLIILIFAFFTAFMAGAILNSVWVDYFDTNFLDYWNNQQGMLRYVIAVFYTIFSLLVFGVAFKITNIIISILKESYKELQTEFGKKLLGLIGLLFYIIFIWVGIYLFIYAQNPNSFASPTGELSTLDFLYYSVITIVTLGYGDIHPLTPSAKIFSVLEVLLGVFLIAVYLSYIVSKHLGKSDIKEVCTKCGAQNLAESKYCSKCGKILK